MDIVTIACPPGFTDPNVDPETAPIWIDANGIEYRVASGLLDGYALEKDAEAITDETIKPAMAQPDRVNVVVGMDGLDALAAMGLTINISTTA
jgi:hypothetical protein